MSKDFLNKRLCVLELEQLKDTEFKKKMNDMWEGLNNTSPMSLMQQKEYTRLITKYNEERMVANHDQYQHLNMLLITENGELREYKRKYDDIRTKYDKKKKEHGILTSSMTNTTQMVKNLSKEVSELKEKQKKHKHEKEKRIKQKKNLRVVKVDLTRVSDSIKVINKFLPELCNVVDHITKFES